MLPGGGDGGPDRRIGSGRTSRASRPRNSADRTACPCRSGGGRAVRLPRGRTRRASRSGRYPGDVFDINGGEWLVLLVVAVIVIGPERLPGYAEQLARLVKRGREFVTSTRTRLDEELGDG